MPLGEPRWEECHQSASGVHFPRILRGCCSAKIRNRRPWPLSDPRGLRDGVFDGDFVSNRFVLCDGAELARFWARIGSDETEELLWIPRDEESRARPPGFRALPGGLNAESIEKLDRKHEDVFAVVSEELPFVRAAVGAIAEAAPEAPVLVMSDRIEMDDLPDHRCLRLTGLRTQFRDDVHITKSCSRRNW